MATATVRCLVCGKTFKKRTKKEYADGSGWKFYGLFTLPKHKCAVQYSTTINMSEEPTGETFKVDHEIIKFKPKTKPTV